MSQGRKTEIRILLTPEERHRLESWQRSTTISHGLAKRGRIILMFSSGSSISEISRTIHIARGPVYKWIKRFAMKRIDGLSDKTGRGRRPFFPCGDCHPSCKDGMRET